MLFCSGPVDADVKDLEGYEICLETKECAQLLCPHLVPFEGMFYGSAQNAITVYGMDKGANVLIASMDGAYFDIDFGGNTLIEYNGSAEVMSCAITPAPYTINSLRPIGAMFKTRPVESPALANALYSVKDHPIVIKAIRGTKTGVIRAGILKWVWAEVLKHPSKPDLYCTGLIVHINPEIEEI